MLHTASSWIRAVFERPFTVNVRKDREKSGSDGLTSGVSLQGGGFSNTPAGKAVRGCVIYCSEYLDCSLVQGKDAGCMKKWDEMDKKRRERTKGSIDIK